MKKQVLFLSLLLLSFNGCSDQSASSLGGGDTPPVRTQSIDAEDGGIASAFVAKRSDIQVSGAGEVAKILSDDNKGSRHQRFIVRLPSGHTVLIAHNIDLAPRVEAIEEGETIRFHGEYEWNKKGGVIHWTHHDPKGRHPGGWLEYQGRRYQ